MPRILRARAREPSPACADTGGDTDPSSSPTRSRRNLKRTASQALPPTPPRTVKREKKSRVAKNTASGASKNKSPTRGRSRGVRLEKRLERIAEEEEEQDVEEQSSLREAVAVGRRLDFGPAAKRRKLEELDARLETLLESLDGEDDENPFWDGPVGPKASKDDAQKGGDKIEGAEERGRSARDGRAHGDSTKTVRIRSPSPPLLSFRGKAPVSPPPSNRRKRKVRGKVTIESIIEEEVETAEPPVTSTLEYPLESAGESSSKSSVEEALSKSSDEESAKPAPERSGKTEALVERPAPEPVPESSDEPSAEATINGFSETPEETPVAIEKRHPKPFDDPFAEPEGEPSAVDLPPMPSTPKKGKKRMDSPIRDSANNPFLDDSPASVSGEPVEPRTPTNHGEKPTITYVFRGVRAEFANPMYNLPPEVHERSLLPVEHPDYSPDPLCPPKLLFPKTQRRQASPSPTRHKGKGSDVETRSSKAGTSTAPSAGLAAGNGWDDSDDEAELHITPPKRLFQ